MDNGSLTVGGISMGGRRVVLDKTEFCTNKPILASLLRQFFGGGGKGGVLPKKRV